MGDGAITFLLENLTRLLSQEADLLHGVEEEVRSLQTELKLIEPWLRDYGQKHNEPDIKTEFINQLRDAAREAEDIIDPYVASVAQQRRGNFLVRTKNRLQWLSSRQRVAKQIQGIKKRFENLFRQKDKYEIQISQQADLIPVETNSPMRRRLVEETDVVGLDDVARDITERLTEGEARRVVIPIVGMGGIGKTTLARKVYNDPVVVKHFDFRAWVFVSQAHDARNLLQALLKSAVGMLMEEMKDMSNEDLGYELRRYLTSAKYMIILDDVSKPDCWDELNQVFANNNYGSRIIITTQDDSVARHVNEKPLKLHFLSEEKSWELFSKKVFLVERCPADLEDLGKQMAEKCKGLPLAIVVLAGVLLKKEKTRWWWSKVSLDVSSILTEQTDHCIKILQLSYDNLPNHLKTCFLYFGLFPNNFEISARKLVRLWIAEGFVQKKDNETMEEVAEEYLGDLIARNVVQVSETYVDGTVKACCVHNILHKICIFKAKEEKFLEVCAFGSSYTLLSNLRRLGLHSSMLNYISSNPASSTLRSMLCFGPEERPLSLEAWKLLYKRFPLLRVLDAGIVGVEVIPNDIHKLLHLRYLTLKSPSAQTLPASISNLWNLQTLVVAAPNIDRPQLSIWKMKELRHLRFRGQLLLSEPPQENDSDNVSINLQTLYCISPDSCTERVFSMLPNLLKLGIQGNLEEHRLSGKFQNFSKLNRLLTLKLERDRSCKKLDSLRYVEFPSSLNKLTLVETQLLEDPMDILGQLLNLRVLILKNAAYNGRKLNCRSNGFPKLEAFHLVNLAIRSWTISQGSMARLRSVVINRCGRLEGLPSALQNMPAFQEMELSNHVQLVNQAREIEKSRGKEHFKLVICSLKIN